MCPAKFLFVCLNAFVLSKSPQSLADKRCTHHAGGLHSLTKAGSGGLTPEHVADEVPRALGHDEGKGVDVLPHAYEGQEPHPALRKNLLCLQGTQQNTLGQTIPTAI